MAKVGPAIATENLSVTINSQTGWYLDRLIETGLYGNSRQDSIRVLVYDHCKLLIAEGRLKEAPTLPGSSAKPILQK